MFALRRKLAAQYDELWTVLDEIGAPRVTSGTMFDTWVTLALCWMVGGYCELHTA